MGWTIGNRDDCHIPTTVLHVLCIRSVSVFLQKKCSLVYQTELCIARFQLKLYIYIHTYVHTYILSSMFFRGSQVPCRLQLTDVSGYQRSELLRISTLSCAATSLRRWDLDVLFLLFVESGNATLIAMHGARGISAGAAIDAACLCWSD